MSWHLHLSNRSRAFDVAPQSLQARKFATSHAASPTCESLSPAARLCGFVDWTRAYAPSFCIHPSFLLRLGFIRAWVIGLSEEVSKRKYGFDDFRDYLG